MRRIMPSWRNDGAQHFYPKLRPFPPSAVFRTLHFSRARGLGLPLRWSQQRGCLRTGAVAALSYAHFTTRFLQTVWGRRQIHFSVTILREAESFTPGMLIFSEYIHL